MSDYRDLVIAQLADDEVLLRDRLVAVIVELATEVWRWHRFADAQYRGRLEAERQRDAARASVARVGAEFRAFRLDEKKRRSEAA